VGPAETKQHRERERGGRARGVGETGRRDTPCSRPSPGRRSAFSRFFFEVWSSVGQPSLDRFRKGCKAFYPCQKDSQLWDCSRVKGAPTIAVRKRVDKVLDQVMSP